MIKQVDIKDREIVDELIKIIQNANATVAKDLNLNKKNAPGHTSLITKEKLLNNNMNKLYYIIQVESKFVGCVVLEKSPNNENEYFIENLAVLPNYRHFGYGTMLIKHLINLKREENVTTYSIGLINENEQLKSWYLKLGFQITGTKKFKHLPFTVCFMKRHC